MTDSFQSYSKYFMYFNWLHRDFEIEFGFIRGNGTVSVGSTGQLENN